MWIRPLTNFLDDKEKFYQGELRWVDEERGTRLLQLAWAAEAPDPNFTDSPEAGQGTSIDLDVQSSKLALGDNHG